MVLEVGYAIAFPTIWIPDLRVLIEDILYLYKPFY